MFTFDDFWNLYGLHRPLLAPETFHALRAARVLTAASHRASQAVAGLSQFVAVMSRVVRRRGVQVLQSRIFMRVSMNVGSSVR